MEFIVTITKRDGNAEASVTKTVDAPNPGRLIANGVWNRIVRRAAEAFREVLKAEAKPRRGRPPKVG